MNKTKVYFRADGNAKIGLGHIFRCLALAEMLSDEFECYFVTCNPLSVIKEKILKICKALIELPFSGDIKEAAASFVENELQGYEIVVLDGYQFNTEYQRIIKKTGCKVVCIDDIYAYHFVADIVINHAGGLSSNIYSAEPYTQFYLGLKYALLRTSFREIAQNRTYEDRKNNIFICLGGADPNNDTLNILRLCEQIKDIEKCYLIIGGGYRYKKELVTYIESSSLEVELLSNLSAKELVYYMRRCQKAITPPSTIAYEYLSVGGELYLKIIADNQISIYNFFITNGIAFDINTLFQKEIVDSDNALLKQRTLFDGMQKKRFLQLFRYLTLVIRRAVLADLTSYFEWTNDYKVRLQSFNPEPILLSNHISWFKNKISSEKCVLYILELKGHPVGQIRFDFEEKEAIISYSVSGKYRRLGLGVGILRQGIAKYRTDFKNFLPIVGFVKKDNTPSVKAFLKIGFREEKTDRYHNSFKYILA